MATFYVLERTNIGPEITDVSYKHLNCRTCGVRPVGRVGSTGVRFTRSSDLTDFSRTAGGLLVRSLVVPLLSQARLTGWRAGPVLVEAISRLRNKPLDYLELIVVGHTRCYTEYVPLRVKSECMECGRLTYERPTDGLVIPEQCWDQSDIFVIDELPGIYIVTEPFRETALRHGLTGVEFEPISQWRDSLSLSKH